MSTSTIGNTCCFSAQYQMRMSSSEPIVGSSIIGSASGSPLWMWALPTDETLSTIAQTENVGKPYASSRTPGAPMSCEKRSLLEIDATRVVAFG